MGLGATLEEVEGAGSGDFGGTADDPVADPDPGASPADAGQAKIAAGRRLDRGQQLPFRDQGDPGQETLRGGRVGQRS